jgi:hypothetical protein
VKKIFLYKNLTFSFFEKISLFFLAILIPFAFSQVSLAEESNWPQGDFDLVQGVYRINNPSDPAPIDKEYQIIFANTLIQIRDGKFSENQNTGISFRMSEAQSFTGTGSLTISGTYDKDTGKISGNYIISNDVSTVYQLKGATWHTEGWAKTTESGTFQGQLVNDYVVLTFFCKKASGESYNKNASGKEERKTINKCAYSFYKVAFRVAPVVKLSNNEEKPEEKTEYLDYGDPAFNEVDYEGKVFSKPKRLIDSGARFAGLTGQVDIIFNGKRWAAKMGDVIPVSAVIVTEEDSSAIISFIDMSTFVVKPETNIIVSAPPEKDSKLKLVAGKIWANVKKMAKDGTMEIETNQAVSGIKGTTFVCEEKNGISVLKVIDGTVDFKSKTNGNIVKVNAGEMVKATTNGLSEIAKFDIAEESESWTNLNKVDWGKLDKEDSKNITAVEQAGEEIKTKNSWSWILILAIITVVLALIGFRIIKKIKHQNRKDDK